MKRLKRILLIFLLLSIIFTGIVFCCDKQITTASAPFLYDDPSVIPHYRVGLVLGTSERTRSGRPNRYFQNRIVAATELVRAGKVDHLLLSGDNSRKDYNEPGQMRQALIAAGVDSTKITLDFAGFRTLDSVVRAQKVFGTSKLTIAPDVPEGYGKFTMLREKLARTKVYFDILLGIGPKFLGDPVPIEDEQ